MTELIKSSDVIRAREEYNRNFPKQNCKDLFVLMIEKIIEIYADHEMYQMHGNGD